VQLPGGAGARPGHGRHGSLSLAVPSAVTAAWSRVRPGSVMEKYIIIFNRVQRMFDSNLTGEKWEIMMNRDSDAA
jgi:hypothetical protein